MPLAAGLRPDPLGELERSPLEWRGGETEGVEGEGRKRARGRE